MADTLVSSYSQSGAFPPLNGYVIHLFLLQSKNFVSSARMLHDLFITNDCHCTFRSVDLKLRRLVKDYKSKKERKRDFPKLERLLKEVFTAPALGPPRPSPVPVTDIVEDSNLVTVRGDCAKCAGIRKENATISESWRTKCASLRKDRNVISKVFNKRRFTFKLSRKDKSIAKYKSELATLKKEHVILERKLKTIQEVAWKRTAEEEEC